MSKFKKGDRVKRISTLVGNSHCGMKVGDVATVRDTNGWGSVYLEGFYGGHAEECFELVRHTYPNPPHKHAEVIKAWADGAEIHYFSDDLRDWVLTEKPMWLTETRYRIAPTNPNADKIAELEKTIDQAKKQLQELKDGCN